MRKVLVALALLGLAGGAVADDLSDGVFICHNVPGLGYTTENDVAYYCNAYWDTPITDCAGQVNMITSSEYTYRDNFFVLVAWAAPKTFCAAEFGLGAYDTAIFGAEMHGPCGTDPQTIPTTDPAWPTPGSGIAIAWAADNAPSGNFVPVYFFGGYCYGPYYGSTTIPLIPDPAQDFIGTASCDVPPVTYPAYDAGTFGVNTDGVAVCYPQEEPWACCFGQDCVMLTRGECEDQGGVFMGEDVMCDPNPCIPDPWACCFGPECVMLIEDDCVGQGGEFMGEGVTCDPNPCEQPGACCFDGECAMMFEADCLEQGGDWDGAPSCDPNPCPPPRFACCFLDGSCQVADEVTCMELGGMVYYDFDTCEPNPCPDMLGACCFVDHSCVDDVIEEECFEMGGVAWFVDETCATAPCEDYTPTDGHSWGEIKDMYR